MPLRYTLAFLLLSLAGAGQDAAAQDNRHLTVQAERTDGIRVDGVLDEADWATAEPATGFIQFNPTEGEPATQPTEVRVLYGSDALYIGAMLYDDDPAGIRTYLSRRDRVGGADFFLVAIDSYNDRTTGYEFLITAAGVQWDAIATPNGEDSSWDAVWTSAAQVTPEGWVAEMEIPYSQLRFSEGDTSWGVNFVREIQRNGEKAIWAPLTRENSNSAFMSYAGRLTGLTGIAPRRTLQLTPYSLARANTFENANEPGRTDSDFAGDVGADLRFGLSSNVTLDATVNPDFGQVDADPAELNLSTFETFFSERRPFFLEGTQIFDYTYGSGDGALLYTRRIGGAAPIIGATKISGRSAGGLSFGVLGAATGEDFDPNRWYGVARAKQEFGALNYIGGGVTAFDAGADSSRGFDGSRSIVGGADWRWRVLENESWQFEGTLTGSVQTQKDDDLADPTARGYALYVGFDKVKGFFTPGSGLRIYSDQFRMNDVGRFRQNNLIQARLGSQVLFNRGEPVGPFRRISLGGFGDQGWSYDDRLNRGFGVFFFGNGELKGFQNIEVSGELDGLGGYDVRETRGLGPFRNILNGGISLDYRTDRRRPFVFSPEIGVGFSEDGGRAFEIEGDVEWNVSDRVDLSLNAEFGTENDWTAWAANEGLVRRDDGLFIGTEAGAPDGFTEADLFQLDLDGPGADVLLDGLTPFDSPLGIPGATGYFVPVFGSRDTRAFDLSMRANVIVNPRLSLQLYGQLFAARGRYDTFRLLAGRDELRDFDYPRRRDFSFQSLQANAVLRWEYRQGSTLFVVWTQARNFGESEALLLDGRPLPDSPFDAGTGSQLRDTFRIFPENAFLVKLSYLLMR